MHNTRTWPNVAFGCVCMAMGAHQVRVLARSMRHTRMFTAYKQTQNPWLLCVNLPTVQTLCTDSIAFCPRANFSKMFSKIYGRILGKSFSKICGGRRQNFAADVFSKIFFFLFEVKIKVFGTSLRSSSCLRQMLQPVSALLQKVPTPPSW